MEHAVIIQRQRNTFRSGNSQKLGFYSINARGHQNGNIWKDGHTIFSECVPREHQMYNPIGHKEAGVLYTMTRNFSKSFQ